MGTIKKRNGSKAAGMDGISEKRMKNRDISIIDWLLRTFNRCMKSGVVPEDLKAACIVLIYKGKEDRNCER